MEGPAQPLLIRPHLPLLLPRPHHRLRPGHLGWTQPQGSGSHLGGQTAQVPLGAFLLGGEMTTGD